MPQLGSSWTGIAQTLKQISSFLPSREGSEQEAMLYYRRACLAAAEERYDVALVFCNKALLLDGRHLPSRLLVAQIHHWGNQDVDAAIKTYRKVISLSGYDGDNPYCAAARTALDALVNAVEDSRADTQESLVSPAQP